MFLLCVLGAPMILIRNVHMFSLFTDDEMSVSKSQYLSSNGFIMNSHEDYDPCN